MKFENTEVFNMAGALRGRLLEKLNNKSVKHLRSKYV